MKFRDAIVLVLLAALFTVVSHYALVSLTNYLMGCFIHGICTPHIIGP